jgi:uncharacterized membrane protein
MSEAHWHLIVSHLPVLGVPFGAALLVAGLVRRSVTLQRTGLTVLMLAGVAAGIAYLTGESAEHAVERMADRPEAVIEAHEEAALIALVGAGLLGLFSAAALWRLRRNPAGNAWGKSAVVLAVGVAVVLGWAANLGGRIAHPEIRPGGESVQATSGHE